MNTAPPAVNAPQAPAQGASGAQQAQLTAYLICQIADTAQWQHPQWRDLLERLARTGKTPAALTLADLLVAIVDTRREAA